MHEPCRNVSDCVAGPLSQKVPACPTGRAGQWEACAPLYTRPEAEPNSTDITPKPASGELHALYICLLGGLTLALLNAVDVECDQERPDLL
eukprot:1155693-Pelagomonas_calceolata.AAC.3